MKRSLDEIRDYFNAKNDENDFAALDYLVNGRPLTLEEYDALIWSSVEKEMEFQSGQDILEIGAGVGFGLAKLENRAQRLVGTDISENLLKRYKGKAEIYPLGADEINFGPDSFDRIFMISVSILFPDFDYFKSVVRKSMEHLKDDGVLGIFDQYLYVSKPHPRYLSLNRADLSFFLDELGYPYTLRAQNRLKRKMSNRYDIIIYKDKR